MPRNEQQPEVRDNGRGRGGKAYSHPAFGQINASRVSGSTTLFGSDFVHNHYVTIRISRAGLNRDLSRDWHFQREEIVEVAVSEMQWATFVSSMNVGAGSPCTIQRVEGESMPGIPRRVQEDEFKAELDGTVRGMVERVDRTIQAVREGVGSSLSGKKQAELMAELNRLRQDLSSNLPFVARSFEEHMEHTVERAKGEVTAYTMNAVMRAGLSALSSGGSTEPAPLLLSATNESE
jgi:hypothetical protein